MGYTLFVSNSLEDLWSEEGSTISIECTTLKGALYIEQIMLEKNLSCAITNSENLALKNKLQK